MLVSSNINNDIYNTSEKERKKSYYENGNIEYDGEWEGGEYNGNGKFYYENGNIKYEGEWK